MPRPHRLHLEGLYCHFILRGKHRKFIWLAPPTAYRSEITRSFGRSFSRLRQTLKRHRRMKSALFVAQLVTEISEPRTVSY